MDTEEPYIKVCSFAGAEGHRAENLVEFLERHGIEASVSYGEIASVPESEAIGIFVSEEDQAEAEALVNAFLSDYDQSVASLVAQAPRGALWRRTGAFFYMWVMPVLTLGVGLYTLWVALSGGVVRALGLPPGSEVAVGTIVTVLGLLYLVSMLLLARKRAV